MFSYISYSICTTPCKWQTGVIPILQVKTWKWGEGMLFFKTASILGVAVGASQGAAWLSAVALLTWSQEWFSEKLSNLPRTPARKPSWFADSKPHVHSTLSGLWWMLNVTQPSPWPLVKMVRAKDGEAASLKPPGAQQLNRKHNIEDLTLGLGLCLLVARQHYQTAQHPSEWLKLMLIITFHHF